MGKIGLIVSGICILVYVGLYIFFYSSQDGRFKATALSNSHDFQFDEEYEEFNFEVPDGGRINSLFFKGDSSSGVICFWKGNGGNLDKWGHMAPLFLKHNYDVIITDYREHGKSRGKITIDNFYSDSQAVYDFLKTKYVESKIVIVGYSLGANIASHLSISNKPHMTVLIEPREKFENQYLEGFFFLFPNANQFPFRTDLDIQKTSTPVVIIIGTKSSLHRDAIKLKKLLDENDKFFEIRGADHGSILGDKELQNILKLLLAR